MLSEDRKTIIEAEERFRHELKVKLEAEAAAAGVLSTGAAAVVPEGSSAICIDPEDAEQEDPVIVVENHRRLSADDVN